MFETAVIKNSPKFARLTAREFLPPMNETEFENFYQQHSRPLWAYVRRVAASAEIADDVTQESFLKFLGAPLRTGENQKAYLYRIATNLTYDYFRRQKREIKRQNAAPVEREPVYEPFASGGGLAAVFDKLNVQERSLLWLAYVEGHRHDEIALMLGLRPLSIRVLLFRAKRRLAGLLEAENGEVKL